MSTNTNTPNSNLSSPYYLVERDSKTAHKITPILTASPGDTITGTLTNSNKEEVFSSKKYELYAISTEFPKEGQDIDFILNNKLCSSILLEVVKTENIFYFKPHDSDKVESANMNEAIPVKDPYSKKLTPRTATNISSPGSFMGVAPGVGPEGIERVPPTPMGGGRYHRRYCNCRPGCPGSWMEFL